MIADCYLLCVQLRLHRYKQRQGEPVFERLKKQLEEVKNAHRGLDGNYRSTAEMDRQRQVIADQAIEEQLHAQTAFRTQGSHLQNVVNKLHAQEVENRKLYAPPSANSLCTLYSRAVTLQLGIGKAKL